MKKLMFITVLSVAFTMQSIAQKTNRDKVPEKVLSAFNQKIPDARNVEWKMYNDSEWAAEFKMKDKEYSAIFNSNGKWEQIEFKIKESDIPTKIRSMLNQNLKGYEIKKAEFVETDFGKFYEFEIKVGIEDFEVTIDAQGNVSKKRISI